MELKEKVIIVTKGYSSRVFGIAEAFKNEGAVATITGRNESTIDDSVQQLVDDSIGWQAM